MVKRDLKTGDLLHCKSNGFLGKSIRKITKEDYNHSAVAIVICSHVYVLDAQKDGFNLRPFDYWVRKYNYDFIVARMNHRDEYKYANRILEKVGSTPYDFESLIIRHPLNIVTGKWRYRGDKESKRMVCSEVLAWGEEIEEYYKFTPGNLYNYTLNSGEFHHYEFKK